MAIVVVGGRSHNAGKTTLVCALLSALPEFDWIAVKVTMHVYAGVRPIYEEAEAGEGTDSARYLAAGARRAFLLTASEGELPVRLREFRAIVGAGADVVFESNRIVNYVEPDVCLAIGGEEGESKASFASLARRMDARVVLADCDGLVAGDRPVFELASFGQVSDCMRDWMRKRLEARAGRAEIE
jgi:hypothetical protein